MAKRKTPKQLAQDAGLDPDDVLLALWSELGFDYVSGPNDLIASRDLNRARRAIGVATRRELKSPTYWKKVLSVDNEGLDNILRELGIQASVRSQSLPPRCITRLKAEARRRGIDPMTGVQREQPEVVLKVSEQPFVWQPPGHISVRRWLTDAELVGIHDALVVDFAGTEDPLGPTGVRSAQLLASAAFRPQTSLGMLLKYPTVESGAAALLHAIVQDHPFHNGNKRTALVAMLVFLDVHGLMLTCDEDALFKLVLQVAQHTIVEQRGRFMADRETLAIAEWICASVRPYALGEHVLPWRKLRRTLTAFGCTLEQGNVGNRVNINRIVTRRGAWGTQKSHSLWTQVHYRDEGSDVERNTIKKIREDLHLDDLHGVDSDAFYRKVPATFSDFIADYRKTIHRLARL